MTLFCYLPFVRRAVTMAFERLGVFLHQQPGCTLQRLLRLRDYAPHDLGRR
jgi:hypothetical protein